MSKSNKTFQLFKRYLVTSIMGASIITTTGIGQTVPPENNNQLTPVADYHLHIRSQQAAMAFAQLPDSPPGDSQQATTATELIAALDKAGIRQGVVLSVAYVFGSPALEISNRYARVRAENDYVAAQISAYPDRLIGACSVNPLDSYALDEIRRCSTIKQMRGLKLHLGNSHVNLHNPEHVKRLLSVFKLADQLSMPIIIHLRASIDFGAEEAEVFIQQILRQVPDLPVQIAHMTGWGGYDEATDTALSVFIQAIKGRILHCDKITFGLGAVVFLPEAAGDDTELAQQVRDANAKLTKRIQQMGPECVVYASDWPSWPPTRNLITGINAYAQMIPAQLGLSSDQIQALFFNKSALLIAMGE